MCDQIPTGLHTNEKKYVHLVSLPFPTRRSSDLYCQSRHHSAAAAAGRRLGPRPQPQGSFERVRRQRDRKSTRLNSSHTVISYAVFCLKKKNVVNIFLIHFFISDTY